jgi:Bacterial aa3 type cytochrome c oxidase subunit IV
MAHSPTSMDFLISAEAEEGRAAETDFDEHVWTYRTFVKYVLVFAAHVAIVLALLAYFFG